MRDYLSALMAVMFLAFGLIPSAHAADLEKPTAINGSAYAVVFPLFDGSTGSVSYLRLFNGGTAATTFNILVVNTVNGITMGSAAIQVAAKASPQYSVTSVGGANSIFTQAGVAVASNATYALYIQDTDALAGYQHVTYNGGSSLFENASYCGTPMNQQFAASNREVVTNVHTTVLAGNAYPSVISLHNYSTASVTVTLAAYDAATGTSVGQVNQTIAANGTLTLLESQIQTLINFTPTSAQPHINLILTNAAGGALPVGMTHAVRYAQLGGEVNLVEACAMNAVPPTVVQVAPSVPVAYCGTATLSAYPTIPVSFNASVAPDGAVRFTGVGQSGTFIIYGTGSGTLNGTSFTITQATGSGSGTIVNGVMSGTTSSNQLGSGTFYATTAGCG